MSKIENVKLQVEEAKDVMIDNIHKLNRNLDNLDELDERTQHLRTNSLLFNKQSKTLKDKFWWAKFKCHCIVLMIFLLIIMVVIIIIYEKIHN
jgi:hypothetical protein